MGEHLYILSEIECGAEINSMCNEILGRLYLKYGINSIIKSNNILNGNYLLLITERWDESMLVLKYAYNLSFDDIVYITDFKINSEKGLSDEQVTHVKSGNKNEKLVLDYDQRDFTMSFTSIDFRASEGGQISYKL